MTNEQADRLAMVLTRIAYRGSCDVDKGECEFSSGPLCQAHDMTLSGDMVEEARALLLELLADAATTRAATPQREG